MKFLTWPLVKKPLRGKVIDWETLSVNLPPIKNLFKDNYFILLYKYKTGAGRAGGGPCPPGERLY
jgi:hypothetical protein